MNAPNSNITIIRSVGNNSLTIVCISPALSIPGVSNAHSTHKNKSIFIYYYIFGKFNGNQAATNWLTVPTLKDQRQTD